MSPSEFDLRSALRDGEGDGPDPDAMLAAGRARASARRTRIAGVSGAVVAILAVGTTGAVLLGRGDDGPTTADRPASAAAGGAAASQDLLLGPPDSAGAPSDPDPGYGGPTTSRSATACPTTFPGTAIGGGGGRSQLGDGTALFPKPVASILVCAFGPTGSTGEPGTLSLLGAKASELVSSLEGANTGKPTVMCPDYRTTADHRFAFVGITSDGTALTAVTTTLGGGPTCDVVVSNGRSLRYAWEPPKDLVALLYAVAPK